jgi:hypothetical protein
VSLPLTAAGSAFRWAGSTPRGLNHAPGKRVPKTTLDRRQQPRAFSGIAARPQLRGQALDVERQGRHLGRESAISGGIRLVDEEQIVLRFLDKISHARSASRTIA